MREGGIPSCAPETTLSVLTDRGVCEATLQVLSTPFNWDVTRCLVRSSVSIVENPTLW